jgi:hypothetical protein
MRAALGLLVLAFGFALWALITALRVPAVVPAATSAPVRLAGGAASEKATVDIDGAVQSDLFSPDRSAPDEPFRMPGDAPAQAEATMAPRPSVLGTAVSADGSSFATAQLSGGTPRIIRPGDRIGDFTVISIERGHVVFTASNGTRFDIAATTASTQDSFNARINSTSAVPVAPDMPDVPYRPMGGRGGAAGRRGRPTRPDTLTSR